MTAPAPQPDRGERGRVTLRERLRRPGWRLLGLLALATLLATAPDWGSSLLSRLDFFRLRRVEVRGTTYLSPDEIIARLRLDTTYSVWDDARPLRRRLRDHPQIATVSIARRLPGTLVVTVRENLPVALVATPFGMEPYDSAGLSLPIDPARTPVDLPVLFSADPHLLAVLGRIAATTPALFGRIHSVQRAGPDAMTLELDSLRVRAMLGVSATRLADIFPVESDLARRGAHISELDLRYRDQVIARLQ